MAKTAKDCDTQNGGSGHGAVEHLYRATGLRIPVQPGRVGPSATKPATLKEATLLEEGGWAPSRTKNNT